MESIAQTTSPEAANQRNLRRLLIAIRSSLGTLNLLIAVCDNPVYRNEIIRSYEAELQAEGVRCHRVELDPSWPSLKEALIRVQAESAGADAAHVVTVLGASDLLGVRLSAKKSAQETFFFSVQWTREGLRQFQFPVVLWVTQAIATGLAQQAPDFWSWRGGTFEFTRPIAADLQRGGAEWLAEPKLAEDTPLADPQELQQQIAELEADDPTSPLLASLYSSLGQTYYDRLEQGKAEDYHQEQQLAIAALQQAIARSTDDPLQLARNANTLGLVYESQGRYAEAEPLYTQALEIRRSQLGSEHPDTATSLNNLAMLYQSQGRYAEAEPLLTQALEIYRSQLGPEHPDTATSLNNLAGLYESQGRYAEAEPLLTQALEIRRSQLGSEHPDTATSLNNLAGLYQSQGRYAEAEPLLTQALEIMRSQLGSEHPATASSLNTLAMLYKSQRRYAEAEPLLTQALEIMRSQLGPEHPDTATSLNNLAGLYESQGRYAEAEPLLTQALEIYRSQLGSEHPHTATSLHNLAMLYESQGRYAEAEPLYTQALEIRRSQLGSEHPDTATSLHNLALLYESQGRYAEAEPLYTQALEILLNQLGEHHPQTQTVRQNFMLFLQQVIAAGRTAELSDHPLTQARLAQWQPERKPGFL